MKKTNKKLVTIPAINWYQEMFDYLLKTKENFPFRLSADLDKSKKDSKLTLGYRKINFWKNLKMNEIKNLIFTIW